jgi:hypothetical protein
MSLQSIFNNQAISMLPKTAALINSSKDKTLTDLVLRRIMNTSPCLDDKTKLQITSFDTQMFNICTSRIKENEALNNN